jgi:hypothetical protein
MYVGLRYSASAEARLGQSFSCPHCGYRCQAIARGSGEGEGASPYMLDNQGAEERAEEAARRAALENARVMLTIAPCPKCNKRDTRAVGVYVLKTVVQIILALVGFPVGGRLFVRLKSHDDPSLAITVFFGALGVLVAAWLYMTRRLTFLESSYSIKFIPPEDERSRSGAQRTA